MSQMKYGRVVAGALMLAAILARPAAVSAQLDPLLMIKKGTPATPVKPNIIFAVDSASRMQNDGDEIYYDPNDYVRLGSPLSILDWEATIGVDAPTSRYRRKYFNLLQVSGGSDKMTADRIETVGDDEGTAFTNFFAKTRLHVARTALVKALTDNSSVARFGLIRMRQTQPEWGDPKNIQPVAVSDAGQQTNTELGGAGKWAVTRPEVSNKNGTTAAQPPIVLTDAANSNNSVFSVLSQGVNGTGLIPAGFETGSPGVVDAPIDLLMDDAKTEATRLIAADGTNCRNTIVVLVVGGKMGTTSPVGANPVTKASQFLAISSRRVPIYVIAIAPPPGDVAQLTSIATNSGGQYFEITKQMIADTPAGTPVPEAVRATNIAISHGFMDYADCNMVPAAPLPYGPQTEFQVTSPVVGTVNLKGMTDINGTNLPDSETDINHPVSGAAIPQRSNVLITTAFALPNFEGKLRAARVYKPVVDATKPTGYKFTQSGTKLWVASAPAAASRNIFTVTQNGTMTALTVANVATLAPFMNVSVAEATRIITYVRAQPLGPFVGSTPAFMDPPSIDPPPDADYPGFIDEHKDRRTLIWIGGNDGMMHAIDARTGVEVYAFIPFNLLPKLQALPDGNAVGSPDFFVDSSPKLADVRIGTTVATCAASATTCWRTYLFFGQGPGGTFYQALDVTLADMALAVNPVTGTTAQVLAYFADGSKVKFRWSFPHYSDFDYTLAPYGDVKSTASPAAKSVGETWSDPAVGQIANSSGRYALLTGSGFFPASKQAAANRGNVVAGTTFYLLNIDDGTLFDSTDVGNDSQGENTDNCATEATPDCTKIKNAIQADVVATGPPDSRFITKAYVGDLDGNVWRFDFAMVTGLPKILAKTNLSAVGRAHPLFASMATVNVGSTQNYIFFGTGSDLLPSAGIPSSHQYKLMSVLDNGGTGTVKYTNTLQSINLTAPDEKVTGFPAVAGDIVFFVTTLTKPNLPCNLPDATLYATTFTGGLGYTAQAGAQGTGAILTVTGARATAPFIVDQHVAFGFGNKVEMLGDQNDYNNGVGQVGVRILSWRDVR
jgi:hypothetical protein